MKSSIFWDSESSACYLLHAIFLRGLVFDPEDGGDMFLRNFGYILKDYMELYPTALAISEPQMKKWIELELASSSGY
jgi:hypothetical protein